MATTIIGDVHGKMDSYIQIAKDCEASVQVGDMGFNYYALKQLNANKHMFFGGNHDNYDEYYDVLHNLGDFGNRKVGSLKFFFVRGAFSVDIMYRLDHNINKIKSWWPQEELRYDQMRKCEELYRRTKPSVVLSHTAPTHTIKDNFDNYVLGRLGFGDKFVSQTSSFLQTLFEIHQPDLWVFGHFHKSIKDTINGTEFICLPELGFIDV